MKTLLLASAGLKIPAIKREVLKLLKKPPSETKLAHIITASKVAENTDYLKKDKQAMRKIGFQVKDIDIEGKTKNQLRRLLKDKDIIYVQGGNGFYLLKHVRTSGFDKVVKELLKKDVLYVGVSAGTYIACPTIEMHTWKREKNRYGVTDLTAMNLVPFLVSVHYNREKYRQGLKTRIAKTKYPVKILTDDQALLVEDGKVILVGEGEEVKL